MKLYTLTGYAKHKGITRQGVDEAKKKGKLKVVRLPMFVEYEGEKHFIEDRQFVIEE